MLSASSSRFTGGGGGVCVSVTEWGAGSEEAA